MRSRFCWILPGAFMLAACLFAGCGGQDEQGTDAGRDDGGPEPACTPACPATSTCQDRDGVGAPECVTPGGALTCADDTHCPDDGVCTQGMCVRICACLTDDDCPLDHLCVTEDEGCGLCVPLEPYLCSGDGDCVVVVDASNCCRCPRPRNRATLEATTCLVPHPQAGDPPAGCEPDCAGIDHCWPCEQDPAGLHCQTGFYQICRF